MLRLISKGTLLGVAAILFCGVTLVGAIRLLPKGNAETVSALPVLGTVGVFALIDQDGHPVRQEDLLGKVWIADFIFTRCGGPCPVMTSTLSALQSTLPPQVRFVSFSVDPQYDTPERLREYAKRYGASRDRWSFLTGDKEQVYSLARDLKLTAVEAQDQFIHSSRYVLIDRDGQVRGVPLIVSNDFSIDRAQLAKLKKDVGALLTNPR